MSRTRNLPTRITAAGKRSALAEKRLEKINDIANNTKMYESAGATIAEYVRDVVWSGNDDRCSPEEIVGLVVESLKEVEAWAKDFRKEIAKVKP